MKAIHAFEIYGVFMHKNLGILGAATFTAALLAANVLAAPPAKIVAKKPAAKAPATKARNSKGKAGKPAKSFPTNEKAINVEPHAPPVYEGEMPEGMMGMPGGMPPGMGGMPPGPQSPVDRLFGRTTSNEDFQKALLEARAANAPAQTLLEAQILRNLRDENTDAVADMIPEVEKAMTTYTPETSKLFSSPQVFQGFLTGLHALDARRKDDAAGFEKLLKDAFWQSPELAPLYSQWATEFQEEQALAKISLPLDLPLASADGGTQTLKQLIGTNKAALIDVWASWCQWCMIAMPELPAKANKLTPQGVVLAGMNVGDEPTLVARIKQARQLSLPWLMEPKELPYSSVLKISTLPRMILVTPDGRVLFNGHPNSPRLKVALKKIGVEM
jgi:thiol-disulfide isomerase/thioredoxin